MLKRTKELFASSSLFNDLDEARLQLLDGGNVVREDTHVARLCGKVDLNAVLLFSHGRC